MKPTELRIGNLLLHEGKYVKLFTIIDAGSDALVRIGNDIAGKFKMYKEHFLSECKPIELTEEWLIKFGFIKKKFTDGNEYFELDKTNYSNFNNPIHINNEFWKCYRFKQVKGIWYFGIYEDPKSIKRFVQKEIIFVHQLQNVYFALTGEELIYKP